MDRERQRERESFSAQEILVESMLVHIFYEFSFVILDFSKKKSGYKILQYNCPIAILVSIATHNHNCLKALDSLVISHTVLLDPIRLLTTVMYCLRDKRKRVPRLLRADVEL